MRRAGTASAAVFFAVLGTAQALPQTGQVVAGTGTVAVAQAQAGSVMTVTQSTPKLVINWQSFNTVTGEKLNFVQPGASSIVLNRVLDASQTSFLGTLTATGQVFLVNPSGILFGAGSQVNVAGLVASSRSISDADFLAGIYRFGGAGVSNPVVNQGQITARDGGYVALIGPIVQNGGSAQNPGTIVTPHGTALLAGADQVTLQLNGSSLLGYTIDRGAVNAFAENTQFGTITANGGKVILTAKAVNALAPAVVNNYGLLEATTIVEAGGGQSGGVIQLLGDMAAGQVNQNGKLDASARNGGSGGIIEISAKTVTVANTAEVTTEALPLQGTSGKVFVTADNFRIDRSDRGSADIRRGDMSSTQLQNELEHSSSVTIATSTAGDITVAWPIGWSTGSTLNLSSGRNIVIDAGILGAGNLMLRADSTGTGVGDIFITPALANFMPNGHADLYYNPSDATKNIANFFTGSVNSYWLVNDLAHLQAMNANLAGNYALGRDIDASGSNITPFIPVGSFTGTAYSGKFDGLSHIISGLNVSSADSAVGLFGLLNGATVSNVGLAGGTTTATNAVTGVAGGLAGYGLNSTIRNVFNTGSVSGQTGAGGLVGISSTTNIQDSYTSGAVTSIAGPVGGLVSLATGGAILRSYSSGPLTGQATGLVGGFINASVATQDNYWYSGTPVTGAQQAGITKLDTVAQLNNPNSFGGFDLNTTWRQYDGFGAPLLKSFLKPLTITLNDSTKIYDGLVGAPAKITFSDAAATASGTGLVFEPPSATIRNAGVYTFNANARSGQINGFDISYAGGKTSATITVQKAPLSIAATGEIKTYDGKTSSIAKPTVTGLQPGDTVDTIQSYDSRNAGNAGARTLTASLASISDGNGGNNYAIQYVSAGGTILRAPLAIAAVSDTKAFDGTTTSGKTALVTGLMPGDSLATNVETFDAASIGTRVLSAATIVNDGNGGANYTVSNGTAAGQILGGQAVLDGLLSGSQSATAVGVAAAFLTDPGSRLAAARGSALLGVGAGNPTNILAQLGDEALLYSSDSRQVRESALKGRQGRHTFNVEGSGIRLPEGVE